MVTVSIIITTYNEEKNIELFLKSCLKQTFKDLEIILVDSVRTTDRTIEIARKYTKNIYKYGNERSMQRNYGVKKAKGKYVLILDADMQLSPNVIKECVKVIKKERVEALIIPEKSYGESYWANCKALERNCYINDDLIEAARFFRKDIFLKVRGFNEKMISGEDWDLSKRIKKSGGRIGRINSLIYHNEGKLSLIKDLRKKLYYAQNAGAYVDENVKGFKGIFLYIFRPAYFRNWKLLLSDPFHFVGFLIMKFLEIFIGGIVILTKTSLLKKMLPI